MGGLNNLSALIGILHNISANTVPMLFETNIIFAYLEKLKSEV